MEKSLEALSKCCLWREYLLIFVCLGTKRFSFNRLLKELDRLVEKGAVKDSLVAQIGHSTYKPKNYEYKSFMDLDEYNAYVNEADLIITHGGTGAIIRALKAEKQVIAVPRLAKYEEHSDNHQLQIIDHFFKEGYIYKVQNPSELETALNKVRIKPIKKKFSGGGNIINILDQYIK